MDLRKAIDGRHSPRPTKARMDVAALRQALAHVFGWGIQRLWHLAPLEPWPAWKFGQGRTRASAFARRLMMRGYRAVGVHSLVKVSWYRGLRVNVDFASEAGETMFLSGTCEPNELRFIAMVLESGMTAIDVGANVGWVTLLMAGCVGQSGRVVAFEPSPRERRVLEVNQRDNGLTWVDVREEALSDSCSTVALHVADTIHSGHNTMGGFMYEGVREAQTVPVPAVPLDSLAGELGLGQVDFIKIDVEGAEACVLRGAQETLRRCRPILLVEAQPESLHWMGDDIGALLRLLEDTGYFVCSFDDATGIPSLDASLPLSANVVAVPRESIERLTGLGAIAPPHPSWIKHGTP